MPAKITIMPGERFGRLVVQGERPGPPIRAMFCRCDCGAEAVVGVKNLRNGMARSCGCLRRDMVAAKNRRHGHAGRGSRPPEYHVWKRMRQRCNDANNHEWGRYGGRGIAVVPEWDDFATFLGDMGPRPSDRHSLDRIDVDGPYSKANCRWATVSTQARNKRNSLVVAFRGRAMPLADLADECGLPYRLLYARLRLGWTAERAATEPVHPCRGKS